MGRRRAMRVACIFMLASGFLATLAVAAFVAGGERLDSARLLLSAAVAAFAFLYAVVLLRRRKCLVTAIDKPQ